MDMNNNLDIQTTFEAFAQGAGLSLNRLSSDFHDFESNETYTCYIIFSAGWESCQGCIIINQCKEVIKNLESIEGKTNEQ